MGLYLWGPGGIGKSYTVFEELKRLEAGGDPQAIHHLYNTRITAKGLFRILEKYPNDILLVEDCERLTQDRDAQGILRSALHAQPGQPRLVTWNTDRECLQCEFNGAIIMLANSPMIALPELKALATRILVYQLEFSTAELTAQLRELAKKGFKQGKHQLEPEYCREVGEFLIQTCRHAHLDPNFRLLEMGYKFFLAAENDQIDTDWRDLLRLGVRQRLDLLKYDVAVGTMEERHAADRQLIKQLHEEMPNTPEAEIFEEWRRRGRKRSQATYYRRLSEIRSGEFDR
jgi:hypothetical protein